MNELCENCIKILRDRYYYSSNLDAEFKDYWRKRQYKHPEEKSKERNKANIFFKAGWHHSLWEVMKR